MANGGRKLSLRRDGGVWFLEVADGARIRYGVMVDKAQSEESLDTFLRGALPVPEVAPLLRKAGGQLAHAVVGDGADADCLLCRMVGL